MQLGGRDQDVGNAVAHDGYCSMYNYLRSPTKKKPLHELDPTPYHSSGHPQGQVLKDLLEAPSVAKSAVNT